MGDLQTPQHIHSPPGCSTRFSVNPWAIQDKPFIVDIQRKQTELSQIIISQQARSLLSLSEPPIFFGEALEFPVIESVHFR